MRQALAFQPEDLRLLPYTGMGMRIPLLMQPLLLVVGELKLEHRSDPIRRGGYSHPRRALS
jgi:hypothetical protein